MKPTLLLFLAVSVVARATAPASAPAVRFILKADPPPNGTPPVDTAAISKELQDFADQEGFVPPPSSGGGWVIGILVNTRKKQNGLLVAEGILRLSRLEGGNVIPTTQNQSVAYASSRESIAMGTALGRELKGIAASLLAEAGAIPPPSIDPIHTSAPGSKPPKVGTIPEYSFSSVKIRSQPAQPPYPGYAKIHHIGGTVRVDLVVDPEGNTVSAASRSGPVELMAYSLEYAMRWKFHPLTVNGIPDYGRFAMTMTFRIY